MSSEKTGCRYVPVLAGQRDQRRGRGVNEEGGSSDTPRPFPQNIPQILDANGLGQEVVHACIQTAFAVTFKSARRQRNDGDMPTSLLLLPDGSVPLSELHRTSRGGNRTEGDLQVDAINWGSSISKHNASLYMAPNRLADWYPIDLYGKRGR